MCTHHSCSKRERLTTEYLVRNPGQNQAIFRLLPQLFLVVERNFSPDKGNTSKFVLVKSISQFCLVVWQRFNCNAQSDKQTASKQTKYKQTSNQTNRHTHTNKQTNKQASKQASKQTNKQTNKPGHVPQVQD